MSLSKSANERGLLAGNIVKNIALTLKGSGGGRNDMASGAGKDISGVEEAFKNVKGLIK